MIAGEGGGGDHFHTSVLPPPPPQCPPTSKMDPKLHIAPFYSDFLHGVTPAKHKHNHYYGAEHDAI